MQNVLAVAAPEKAQEAAQQSSSPPPFLAWETGKAISKRTDIKTILLLGAGPIVIGQVHIQNLSTLCAWCLWMG